jgi:hypothetical protein
MNDSEYFKRFMLTKTELQIIKCQQLLYIQMTQFLNKCNGLYHFFETYLKELHNLYVNVIYERESPKNNNALYLKQMLLGVNKLRITHNVRQYVDDCHIMDISDMDLLEYLNSYFTFLEESE